MRAIEGVDKDRLRLFFLSLLWRAAVTDLKEFSEVALPEDELEKLRLMILSDDAKPLSFYPCQLIHLSTKGVIHNHSPWQDQLAFPDFDSPAPEPLESPTYRFYFDGLIAHIHIGLSLPVEKLGPLIVGAQNVLTLPTVTFEASLQHQNMRAVVEEHGLS